MDIEKLKESFRTRDKVISVISKNGKFRASVINNTNSAQSSQDKHNLPKQPAMLLAKQLSAASLLAVYLKGEERIMLEAKSDGIITNVFAEAIQVGEVRGYVHFDKERIEQISDKADLMGDGLYSVTKVLYAKSVPVMGVVKLQSDDIAADLTYYLFQSEQIPSAVILDAIADENGMITASGGMIIQALPGATFKDVEELYSKVSSVNSISSLLSDKKNVEEILEIILPFEYSILKNDRVDFFCRCSKDSFKSKLLTLELVELQDMKKHNHNEMVCKFCNTH